MSNKKGRYLFVGALLGFIAGLLFAPKKGSELRTDAKNKIEEVKENPKEVLQETFEGVKEKINNIIDDQMIDDEINICEDEINICEDEIVISRTFDKEGESK